MGSSQFLEFTITQGHVKEGPKRVRAQGQTSRLAKASRKNESTSLNARAQGNGKLKIAREIGVGELTVQRVLGETAAQRYYY